MKKEIITMAKEIIDNCTEAIKICECSFEECLPAITYKAITINGKEVKAKMTFEVLEK